MRKVSFVIPCYRSAATIGDVVKEIRETFEPVAEYEIILVNDGSGDDTFEVIRALAKEDRRITGIDLARNFGQHAALMAGFHHVKINDPLEDVVICLDDDNQTPASEAPKLIDKLDEGFDAVYASYENKQHSAFRNLGSRMNERMVRDLLDKPSELQVTSFFAARAFVVEEMKRYANAYPYVIGLLLRTTKNVANVPVTHRARTSGTSGYTLTKLLSLWFNGFTAFSVKPLRMATAAGTIFAILGFVYGIYTIVKRFVNPAVPLGWSSLMAAIIFIGGMVMIMLGLIGEYVGRIYITLNNAPQFVVREVTGEMRADEETGAG